MSIFGWDLRTSTYPRWDLIRQTLSHNWVLPNKLVVFRRVFWPNHGWPNHKLCVGHLSTSALVGETIYQFWAKAVQGRITTWDPTGGELSGLDPLVGEILRNWTFLHCATPSSVCWFLNKPSSLVRYIPHVHAPVSLVAWFPSQQTGAPHCTITILPPCISVIFSLHNIFHYISLNDIN